MSEKDNSVLPFSSFEIERQARIKRSLVIRAVVRGTVLAFAEWLRSLVLQSTQLARRLPARRRTYSDIPERQHLDDRMLADIGITTDRRAWFDDKPPAVKAHVLSHASLLSIVAFRLWGIASICLAMTGPTVAESGTVMKDAPADETAALCGRDLQAVREAQQEMTVRDTAAATGIKESTLRQLLKGLAKEGEIRCGG